MRFREFGRWDRKGRILEIEFGVHLLVVTTRNENSLPDMFVLDDNPSTILKYNKT